MCLGSIMLVELMAMILSVLHPVVPLDLEILD